MQSIASRKITRLTRERRTERTSFSLPAIGMSKCVFNNRAIYRKRPVGECPTCSKKGAEPEGSPDVGIDFAM